MSKRALTYKCVIETPDGNAIGSLGFPNPAHILASIACNSEDELRASLDINVKLPAPEHMKRERSQHDVIIHLYGVNIERIVVDRITSVNVTSVGDDESRVVLKVVINFTRAGMTSTGLNNMMRFENYDSPDNANVPISKPWVNQAFDALKKLFQADSTFVVYIRDEDAPFKDFLESLLASFSHENAIGTTIRRFYDEKFHTSSAIPPFVLEEMNSKDPPSIITHPVTTHCDLVDFITRKGLGYIQMCENEGKKVTRFNNMLHEIRLLSVPGTGNIYYYAQLIFETDPNPSAPAWHGKVLKTPAWLRTGQVALYLIRPKISPILCEEEASDGKNRPYVTTKVPCGEGSGNDLDLHLKMQAAPPVMVAVELQSSSANQKAVTNGFMILSRGAKRAYGITRPTPFVHNEHVVKDDDHRSVIEYLRAIPIIKGLSLALVTGRAGTGKTRGIVVIAKALIKTFTDMKILMVTPSNDPTDVILQKLLEVVSDDPSLAGDIYIRAHGIPTEEHYINKHIENLEKASNKARNYATETLGNGKGVASPSTSSSTSPSTTSSVNLSTDSSSAATPVLDQEATIENLKSEIDLANDILADALGAQDLHSLEQLLLTQDFDVKAGQAKEIFNRRILKLYTPAVVIAFRTVLTNTLLLIQFEVMNGTDPRDTPMDINVEETIVVGESVLLDNGLIDSVVAETCHSKILSDQINASLKPGQSLILDPRFKMIKNSIGYSILATCGLARPPNNYTDDTRWSVVRSLLTQLMEEGDAFSINDRAMLNERIKEIRHYIFSVAKVVAATQITAYAAAYHSSFKPTLIIGDEMGRSVLPEFASVWAHYEASTMILLGDTKQLKPVVTIPKGGFGFIQELTTSTLEYFLATQLSSADTWIQRRAYIGIADIPTERFHHAKADNGNSGRATCSVAHPYTQIGIALINRLIAPQTPEQERSAAVYIHTKGAVSVKDSVTKSWYNLTFASIALSVIEGGILDGIPGQAFGVITPYSAQIHIYQNALRRLHLRYPTAGYDKGNEAHIVIYDTGVTKDLGFTNDRGRCYVNLTRAKDLSVVIGQSPTLPAKHQYQDTELVKLYVMAQKRKIVRYLSI
ncbi:hypothetical protein VE03_00106 [Pseudogymnoascus sp. 23342-1-I1]|nr:hypothetical protein VE03_00106 [Pseudogymnoascus sp. 23342-1-I1]